MEAMKLGKITADDLGAIAGNRLNKKRYMKWSWIALGVLLSWAIVVAITFALVEDNDEDEEYKVYEIREHIVVFNQMPTELPTNELKLYNDGDLEYMGARYAPSYTENNNSRDHLVPIVLISIPFFVWLAGYVCLMFRWEREKREFVDVNCEVTIS